MIIVSLGVSGFCVIDDNQVYRTVDKQPEDLTIAGYCVHPRRRFSEAVKVLPKSNQKGAIAYLALKQIQVSYREMINLQALNPTK